MVWIAIIYLLLVGFGSFLEWSVRSRFGTFLFFSMVGIILSGVLVPFGLVFIQATCDMLFRREMPYHEVNGALWFALSLVAGTGWALVQVRRVEKDGLLRKKNDADPFRKE